MNVKMTTWCELQECEMHKAFMELVYKTMGRLCDFENDGMFTDFDSGMCGGYHLWYLHDTPKKVVHGCVLFITELTWIREQLNIRPQNASHRKVIKWMDFIDSIIPEWARLLHIYEQYHIEIDEPLDSNDLHLTIEQSRIRAVYSRLQ
jgi:hypothetical protein